MTSQRSIVPLNAQLWKHSGALTSQCSFVLHGAACDIMVSHYDITIPNCGMTVLYQEPSQCSIVTSQYWTVTYQCSIVPWPQSFVQSQYCTVRSHYCMLASHLSIITHNTPLYCHRAELWCHGAWFGHHSGNHGITVHYCSIAVLYPDITKLHSRLSQCFIMKLQNARLFYPKAELCPQNAEFWYHST